MLLFSLFETVTLKNLQKMLTSATVFCIQNGTKTKPVEFPTFMKNMMLTKIKKANTVLRKTSLAN